MNSNSQIPSDRKYLHISLHLCDEHHGECNCVVVGVRIGESSLDFRLVSGCGTHPEMLQVGVRYEHEINPFHYFPQRFQQGRVKVDIPPAVQQDRHATNLGCDAAGGCYGDVSRMGKCSVLNPIFDQQCLPIG